MDDRFGVNNDLDSLRFRPNSQRASITEGLVHSVAESTVIFGPIRHVGAAASSTVTCSSPRTATTNGRRWRSEPRVRPHPFGARQLPGKLRCAHYRWARRGHRDARQSMTSGPAATSVSLATATVCRLRGLPRCRPVQRRNDGRYYHVHLGLVTISVTVLAEERTGRPIQTLAVGMAPRCRPGKRNPAAANALPGRKGSPFREPLMLTTSAVLRCAITSDSSCRSNR